MEKNKSDVGLYFVIIPKVFQERKDRRLIFFFFLFYEFPEFGNKLRDVLSGHGADQKRFYPVECQFRKLPRFFFGKNIRFADVGIRILVLEELDEDYDL